MANLIEDLAFRRSKDSLNTKEPRYVLNDKRFQEEPSTSALPKDFDTLANQKQFSLACGSNRHKHRLKDTCMMKFWAQGKIHVSGGVSTAPTVGSACKGIPADTRHE